MSNAIGQSATDLAISNSSNPDWDLDMFKSSARRAAKRQVNENKSTTRARSTLNYQNLRAKVCADYRGHFVSIYGKTERFPDSTMELIEEAVDLVIKEHLNEITPQNVLSYRRSFYHNYKDLEVTERVTLVGENKLERKVQIFGIKLFIGAAERRLTALQAKKTPDYDAEKRVKEQIEKCKFTLTILEADARHAESKEEKK